MIRLLAVLIVRIDGVSTTKLRTEQPLHCNRQIEDLTKLATDQRAQIKGLSDQIQVDSIAALQAKVDSETAVLQAKAAAYTKGLQQGAEVGMGTALLLFALIFGIRRLTRRLTVTKKPQARAASA